MVERQLPKLHAGVRFPSPAVLPMKKRLKSSLYCHKSERKVRKRALIFALVRQCFMKRILLLMESHPAVAFYLSGAM
ncbi:MAG: hypothetical protein Udaeo2_32960 [Candidatus Udaeobacter sp.]|nr:MAG: hypothetical protein Udaeo2_32960 [Candidatus Udaeobacter sp.]